MNTDTRAPHMDHQAWHLRLRRVVVAMETTGHTTCHHPLRSTMSHPHPPPRNLAMRRWILELEFHMHILCLFLNLPQRRHHLVTSNTHTHMRTDNIILSNFTPTTIMVCHWTRTVHLRIVPRTHTAHPTQVPVVVFCTDQSEKEKLKGRV